MNRRTRSQTRFSEPKPTTCARGVGVGFEGGGHVVFSSLLQERGHTGPFHLLIHGRTEAPGRKSTPVLGFGEGQCHPEQVCSCCQTRASSGLPQLLFARRSPVPTQKPENKLGPLGWEGGTLQTALPPLRLLVPRKICFTQMTLTCLLQVSQIPAPSPPPTFPALQRRLLSVGPTVGREAAHVPREWELAGLGL